MSGDIGDYSMLYPHHADRRELEMLGREGRMKHCEMRFRLYAINEWLHKIACLKAEIGPLEHEWELRRLPLKEAWYRASYPVEDHDAKRKIKAEGLELAGNYGGPIREKQVDIKRLENLVAAYRERLRVILSNSDVYPISDALRAAVEKQIDASG